MSEWFDNLAINKALRDRDAALYHQWVSMQSRIKEILDSKEWYLPVAYTPHDYSHHFKGVLINASALIDTYLKHFSADEIFCFLIACLLHDIDMAFNPYGRPVHSFNGVRVLSHFASKSMEENIAVTFDLSDVENELSIKGVSPQNTDYNEIIINIHQRLESFLSFLIPNDKYRQAISWIIVGHSDLKFSNNQSINTLNRQLYSYVDLWKDDRSELMHLFELAAFLRWADELDCSRERISGIIKSPLSPEATRYWDKLDAINNVRIAPGIVTIYPNERLFATNLEYYLDLVCELEEKLNKEYDVVQEAINRTPHLVFGQRIGVSFSDTNIREQYRIAKENQTNKKKHTFTSTIDDNAYLHYNVWLSCPLSAAAAKNDVFSVVREVNELFNGFKIRLDIKYWSRDVLYGTANDKQQINEQIVRSSDIFIAVFGQTLDTRTDEDYWATVEEIEYMIKHKKQVFIGFSITNVSINPNDPDFFSILEKLKRVREFKEQYKDKGIYIDFDNNDEIRKVISDLLKKHITQIIGKQYALSESTERDSQKNKAAFPQIMNFYEMKKDNNFFQKIIVTENAPPSFEVSVLYNDTPYKSLSKLIDNIIDNTLILYLLGDAGTGKTYSLIKLWSQLIAKKDTIFIQLHMLDEQDDSIRNYLLTRVFAADEDVLNRFFKYYHIGNKDNKYFVLLLDGFNEIRKEKRSLVLRELNKWIQIYNIRVIVSSRDVDNLSQSIIKSGKAKMRNITEKQIDAYLLKVHQYINPNKETFARVTPAYRTKQLLKNPLMLALYADTSEIFNEHGLEATSYECIKFYSNIYSGSIIIWNYLQSEITKSFSLLALEPEDKFNSFILVRYILPFITYRMQKNQQYSLDIMEITSYFSEAIQFCNTIIRNIDLGVFSELRNELALSIVNYDIAHDAEILMDLALRWLHLFVVDDTNIVADNVVHTKNGPAKNQEQYKKKYRLFHQSVRDCLAAIHIIDCFRVLIDIGFTPDQNGKANVGLINNKYINRLNNDDFSNNPSMLNHIAELEQQNNCVNIKEVFEIIRGLRFKKHDGTNSFQNNMLVKNVVTVMGVINNFDLSNKFDLSNLDLTNVRLDKFVLTKNDTGAILNQSLLGLGTFGLKGHDDTVWSVEISEDRKLVLSSSPNSVRLWDFATKKCKAIIHADDRLSLDFQRSDACFYNDNTHCSFVVGNTVYLYDIANEKQTLLLECQNKIKYIRFSPDGRFFIVGEYNNEMTAFSVDKFKLTKLFTTPEALNYHNDISNSVAAICGKEEIILFNLIQGTSKSTLAGFSKPVEAIRFSRSEKYCASSHGMRKQKSDIIIWDVKKGELLVKISNAHESSICDICFTQDEKYLLSCSLDGVVKIWDVQEGKIFLSTGSYGKSLNSICFVPDAFEDKMVQFLCGDSSGLIHDDYLTNEENFTWYFNSRFDGHAPYVFDIAICKDRSKVYAAYEDALIREWDIERETIRRVYSGHKKSVNCVALSNSERVLASGSSDGTVRLWNLNNLEDADLINEFSSFPGSITALIFDNNDEQLIIGLRGGNIFAIDLDTKERSQLEKIHTGSISEFLITSDNFLLSASDDAKIVKWDLAQLCPTNKYLEHTGRIWSLALHPNKTSFISNSEDGFIIEWNINEDKSKRKIEVPLEYRIVDSVSKRCATAIEYSKDGNAVLFPYIPVAVSINMSCELVEMNLDDKSLRRYVCHTANITQCHYFDNTKKTISCSWDGFIRICDLENVKVTKTLNATRSFGEMVAHCEIQDISFDPSWAIRNYK